MAQPILFQDLHTVVDDLHGVFERWERSDTFLPPLDLFARDVMKLAIHEWVANLVQHADFGERTPLIELSVRANGESVRCKIEDNSRGFDFDLQLVRQHTKVVESAVPAERGRGLLMMIACTDNLRYHQPSPPASADAHDCGHHRLEFSISASKKPWIDIPF
jgi:serine/threonine-protein kinase RsbW